MGKDNDNEKEKEKEKEVILTALTQTEHPSYKRDLRSLGMFARLESIEATTEGEEKLRLLLKTPDKDRRMQIQLESQIRVALKKLEFNKKVIIKFEYDESLTPSTVEQNRLPNVKRIIAVGSGKGGVGKSTVATNLAISLNLAGYKVGLIDGDIYGPSLGKMFGISGSQSLSGDGENFIYPQEVHGVKLISFSFLLKDDQAVVWRGPMLGKAIEQFLFQVMWGELDYLILDLPPGTGDVQLSLAQLAKVDGALLVTTPQAVALQDARRAAFMFMGVNIPLLGIVENMSVFHCPECGHEAHIFSKNGAASLSADLNIPHLMSLPLEPEIMLSCENGKPIVLTQKDSPIIQHYQELVEKLEASLEKQNQKENQKN